MLSRSSSFGNKLSLFYGKTLSLMLIIGTSSGGRTSSEEKLFLTDGCVSDAVSLFDKDMSKYLYDVFRFSAFFVGK